MPHGLRLRRLRRPILLNANVFASCSLVSPPLHSRRSPFGVELVSKPPRVADLPQGSLMDSATSAAAQPKKSDAPCRVPPIAHHHRQSHRQDLRSAHHARHHPRHRPPPDQGGSHRFRHDELRSRLQQHRVLHQQNHLHRRRRRHPALSRLSHRRSRRKKHLSRNRLPAAPRRTAHRRRSSRTGPTTSRITPSSTRASRSFSTAFTTTPIPWA